MACGLSGDDLIVRVVMVFYEKALQRSHTGVFDLTGKIMKGWVVVNSEGYAEDADLDFWLTRGVDFARSLPPK